MRDREDMVSRTAAPQHDSMASAPPRRGWPGKMTRTSRLAQRSGSMVQRKHNTDANSRPAERALTATGMGIEPEDSERAAVPGHGRSAILSSARSLTPGLNLEGSEQAPRRARTEPAAGHGDDIYARVGAAWSGEASRAVPGHALAPAAQAQPAPAPVVQTRRAPARPAARPTANDRGNGVGVAAAGTDSHEALVRAARAGQWDIVTRDLGELADMSALLAALEALDRAGQLDALRPFAMQYAWNQGRLTTAIELVCTMGRGSRSLADVMRLNAIMARLSEADRQAIVAYVARKVGLSASTEGLLAMVDSPMDPQAEAALAATAPGPVAKGPWNPPGEQPPGLYIGNTAHAAIAQHYRVAHDTELVFSNHSPISAILRELALRGVGPRGNTLAKAAGDQGLMPDITNASSLELYEVKPLNAQAEGQSEVALYLSIFHRAGVPMKAGSSSAPGTQGVLPGPGGHLLFYSPVPGVIVYRYRHGDYVPAPQPQEQTQAQENSAPGWWQRMELATGLTGAALLVYLLISEGSRVVFPPRNFVPVP